MITMQETLGVDAARSALAFNNVVEFNSRIDWNIVGPALVVLIIIALLLLWHKDTVAFMWKDNLITRWRGRQRMRADREKKLREILSDNILDAVDLAFEDGDITEDERLWAFETIGKLGFSDLRSKAMTLKEEIKARRAAEKAKEEPAKEGTLSTVHVL